MSKEELIDFYYSQGRKEDENWYQEARDYCEELSKEYQVPLRIVVGILTSLSPRKRWELNKMMTEKFLECQECKHTLTQSRKAKAISMLINKESILNEREQDRYIMATLGGLKTRAFFSNIMYPQTSELVTLDVHILRYFHHNYKPTPKQYKQLSELFLKKAKEYGIPVANLQSRVWCYLRNGKVI